MSEFNCECVSWARVHTDTYPISNHHPHCAKHKTEHFVKVGYDGRWCVVKPSEVHDFINSGDCIYTLTDIYLTIEQYENLPEFNGF